MISANSRAYASLSHLWLQFPASSELSESSFVSAPSLWPPPTYSPLLREAYYLALENLSGNSGIYIRGVLLQHHTVYKLRQNIHVFMAPTHTLSAPALFQPPAALLSSALPSPPHSTIGSQAIFLRGSLVPAGNILPHPSTFCSKQSFTQCCPQPWSSIRIRWPLRGPGQSRGRRMRKYSGLEGADSLVWLPAPAWKFFPEPEGSWELAQRPVPVKDVSRLAWEWGSCETSLYLTGLLRGQVTSWIRKCLIKQHVNTRTCYNMVFMGK